MHTVALQRLHNFVRKLRVREYDKKEQAQNTKLSESRTPNNTRPETEVGLFYSPQAYTGL